MPRPTVPDTPEVSRLRSRDPFLWINPHCRPATDALAALPLGMDDVRDAEKRLERFAPLIAHLFEETRSDSGIIESALLDASATQAMVAERFGVKLSGRLLVKADHALPVAGSVKARGGIYEVLHFAERVALDQGVLGQDESYVRLADDDVREFFSRYTVSVASTGNLGLSIGITATALGFKARVHMSVEAKQWKKRRLRDRGVEVVEHGSDVTEAGRIGREMAAADPRTHFVDDENSRLLFLGYSVAALRLRDQFREAGVLVDPEHPVFVYLPCGLGGAPIGITFGLKCVFGDAVHCFTAEPVDAPCVLLGMLTGFPEGVSVYDIGLRNRTEADGLAVATPSRLVGPFATVLLSGCWTVEDDDLFRFVYVLKEADGIRVEPSAAAGLGGPLRLALDPNGRDYLSSTGLADCVDEVTHVAWTTGGLFVPAGEYAAFHERGRALW